VARDSEKQWISVAESKVALLRVNNKNKLVALLQKRGFT
jgi:hypothetical protein